MIFLVLGGKGGLHADMEMVCFSDSITSCGVWAYGIIICFTVLLLGRPCCGWSPIDDSTPHERDTTRLSGAGRGILRCVFHFRHGYY